MYREQETQRVLARIVQLRADAVACGDAEAVTLLDSLRERVSTGQLAGTMHEMLPHMQRLAAKLPFFTGVLVMFYYRLKALQAQYL